MKTKIIRVRIDEDLLEKLQNWSNAYDEDLSKFIRRLAKQLPSNPPTIPQPPVKL